MDGEGFTDLLLKVAAPDLVLGLCNHLGAFALTRNEPMGAKHQGSGRDAAESFAL